jgi:hypothetical protein
VLVLLPCFIFSGLMLLIDPFQFCRGLSRIVEYLSGTDPMEAAEGDKAALAFPPATLSRAIGVIILLSASIGLYMTIVDLIAG